MRFVEETGGLWTAEQLRAAEAEIEQQKREWEANRLEALQKEQEAERLRQEEDELLTYSRADAKNQVNNNTKYKYNKQPPTLSTKHTNNNRTNRKRGAADHLSNRDITPSPPPQPPNTQKQGRAANKQTILVRKRITSRSTVSNHSGSERRRRKSLAKRSPSVAPAVPQAVKRQKLATTEQQPPKSIMKRVPKVVRNLKARAALLTQHRREAAAQRRMMLHKKAVSTNAKEKENEDQNDSDSSAVQTTPTNAPTEDEESSECSLDAMYDSNDDDNQSEEAPSKNEPSSDEEDVSEEERQPKKPSKVVRNGKTKKNSTLLSSSSSSSSEYEEEEEPVPKTNHFDINSPRSTRSRGTVKLNLWTLDVSPIMPAKRRSKNNQSNPEQSEEPPTTSPVPSINISKKSIANATTTEAEDSCASVGSFKQAKIRDGFNVKTAVGRKKANAKKNLTNPSSSPSTPQCGRHNTLDNWISKSPRTLRALSPMVILNKDDVPRHMIPSPLAANVSHSHNDVDPLSDEALARQLQLDDDENSKSRRTRAKQVQQRCSENGQTG